MESKLSLFSGVGLHLSRQLYPTYRFNLSLLKVPKGKVAEIERSQNQFLWRGQAAFKPHLISWETVSGGRKTVV